MDQYRLKVDEEYVISADQSARECEGDDIKREIVQIRRNPWVLTEQTINIKGYIT